MSGCFRLTLSIMLIIVAIDAGFSKVECRADIGVLAEVEVFGVKTGKEACFDIRIRGFDSTVDLEAVEDWHPDVHEYEVIRIRLEICDCIDRISVHVD